MLLLKVISRRGAPPPGPLMEGLGTRVLELHRFSMLFVFYLSVVVVVVCICLSLTSLVLFPMFAFYVCFT